ncbi:MAG: mammalian cell entry protein [Burkholderiales bacterium]
MERSAVRPSGIRHLRLKVGLLLTLVPLGILTLTGYALNARGVFDPSRRFVLTAAAVDGVDMGMPVTVSGFPIGTVSGLGLSENAEAWIEITVREKDARWLRTTTRFSLSRPLVGGAKILADTRNMQDPPLPPGSRRELIVEDATRDIPVVLAKVNDILTNVSRITGTDSTLDRSLTHLETVTARMAGPQGVLEGLTGNADSANQLLRSLDQMHTLAVTLNGVARRMDRLLANADTRVLGRDGVADEARKAMVQLNAGLVELRGSIVKLDAGLDNARAATGDMKAISASAREATTDLVAVRADVEASLAKTHQMLRELNRKWPFARDSALTLP